MPRNSRRATRALLAAALVATLVPAAAPAIASAGSGNPSPGQAMQGRAKGARAHQEAPAAASELVIGLSPDADEDAVRARIRDAGGTVVRRGKSGPLMVAKGRGGTTAAELMAALEGAPGISSVSVNGRVRANFIPNDTYYQSGAQWGLPRIGAAGAWDVSRGAGITVAVIDSGVDYTHPDLAPNMNSAADYDWVGNDTVAADDFGHGTHVAGIIAAVTNNGAYVAGVAPSATVLPLKVLDNNGYGDEADVADAIYYATDHGAQIINLSLGGAYNEAVDDACSYARFHGVTVVAASGNYPQGIRQDPWIDYPAANPGVIAVGATTESDDLANFSKYDTDNIYGGGVDLVAPGSSIWSTYRWSMNPVALLDGTSMATPHVAGAAALLLASDPAPTPEQVLFRLRGTAVDRGAAGYDEQFGFGRLNAGAAVTSTLDPASVGDAHEPDALPTQATPANPGHTSDHTYGYLGESDFFSVTVEAGKRYTFRTSDLANGADTYLLLYNEQGAVVDWNDDVDWNAGDYSSQISTVAAETGTLYAESIDLWDMGGDYRFSVAPVGDGFEPDDTTVQASPATWGVTYEHSSVPTGDIDYHKVPMQAGRTYRIRTHSLAPGTDTYLTLFEPDGTTELTYSDDVNGELDRSSSITWVAQSSGTHYVSNADVWSKGGTYSVTFEDITPVPTAYVDRLYGDDRYGTSLALSQSTFATGAVSDVVLASGADYPDALAASGLAGVFGSPVLLTRPGDVPDAVMAELDRVSPAPASTTVWIIGGTGAVSSAVESELVAAGYSVQRLGGSTRYETSLLVAEQVRTHATSWGGAVFVATGTGFADALAASPLAYSQGMPVILTPTTALPSATSTWLGLHATDAYVLGGTGVVSPLAASQVGDALGALPTRLAGATRFETAVDIADAAVAAGWSDGGFVGLANGYGFADALAGGAVSGDNSGVLLLTAPTALSPEADAWLVANATSSTHVQLFGGTGALYPEVDSRVAQILP